jgi:hypothetical protein
MASPMRSMAVLQQRDSDLTSWWSLRSSRASVTMSWPPRATYSSVGSLYVGAEDDGRIKPCLGR